jgi:hypothetical protein
LPKFTQRRLLQGAVAVLALIPIGAGLAGVALGARAFDPAGALGGFADSQDRYLSGLLLAIGLAYWSTVPRIDQKGPRFRLLTALVFVGGLARLAGIVIGAPPSLPTLVGLAMELVVTPGLALWREQVERAAARGP